MYKRQGLGAGEFLTPGGEERHRRLVEFGVLLPVVLVHLGSDGGDRVEVPAGAGEPVQRHERTLAAEQPRCVVAGEFQNGAGQRRVVLAHDAHFQHAVPCDHGIEREDHARPVPGVRHAGYGLGAGLGGQLRRQVHGGWLL